MAKNRDKKKPKGFGVSAGTPGRVNAGNPNQLNTGKPKHYGISFSFKYLDQAHKKFCPNHVLHARWFRPFFERLGNLAGQPVAHYVANPSTAVRCRRITWDKTSEPNGFAHLGKHLREQCEPFEFQVSLNKGRFHGFFIDEVFYVVWFDPHHNLYPMDRPIVWDDVEDVPPVTIAAPQGPANDEFPQAMVAETAE